ncbi:helix-turn-helix domain-containing protein [Schinkia azotoformans]|uniref:helix-turn-helix domain-containing protein n=1 Tax=Schinkia azotoformans TaxID=1454 RepID=UPI002DBA23D8|nr:helix-turn-helix transcriptional regulator [Schinkia azotoformans]MEC1786062.1 helix-turn-helix transcriptional regulator [Schinkia azotoformans]MED4420098.1 helix-turn-helix transcriptional regulator [Schinkia azotoformans]
MNEIILENQIEEIEQITHYVTNKGNLFPFKDEYKEQMKREYIAENQQEWIKRGNIFKELREKLNITKAEMERATGFSSSTISKFEQGQPIMNAEKLEKSYSLYLENYQLKQIQTKRVDDSTIAHVQIKQYGKDLYIINLITTSDIEIHISDEDSMQWALDIAKTKFALPMNLPIIFITDDGEEVTLRNKISQ